MQVIDLVEKCIWCLRKGCNEHIDVKTEKQGWILVAYSRKPDKFLVYNSLWVETFYWLRPHLIRKYFSSFDSKSQKVITEKYSNIINYDG